MHCLFLSRLSALGSIPFPTRLGNTLDSRLHILIHCRLGSQSESNTLGSREKTNITSPESPANQNRVLRNPSRHPRALSSGWGPFSALGSSRLAIAYLITWGSPTPLRWSAHTLTTQDSFHNFLKTKMIL